MADNYPTYTDYGSQRQRVQDDYAARTASNSYSTFLSQQRGSRQLGDLSRQYGRAYPSFAASYGRRGLNGPNARSGVYGRALSQNVNDYSRARQDVMQEMVSQQQMAGLTQAQLDAERQRAFADLEFQKQMDIQNAAMSLMDFKTYMGV